MRLGGSATAEYSRGEGHQHDFLNLGSMGHASSVALGIALAKRNRNVVCLDGDSAALMHMGCFTMVSKLNVPNFLHIVLNNGAHESVGGQPSAGQLVDFTKIAEGSGYRTIGKPVETKEELERAIREINTGQSLYMMLCKLFSKTDKLFLASDPAKNQWKIIVSQPSFIKRR